MITSKTVDSLAKAGRICRLQEIARALSKPESEAYDRFKASGGIFGSPEEMQWRRAKRIQAQWWNHIEEPYRSYFIRAWYGLDQPN